MFERYLSYVLNCISFIYILKFNLKLFLQRYLYYKKGVDIYNQSFNILKKK